MCNSKATIRTRLKLLRKKNYAMDEHAAWNTCKNFLNKFKNNFSSIGLYWPMQFELDTRPLIKLLLEKNIEILLPSIKKNKMRFFSWQYNDPLRYNELKFYEPYNSKEKKPPELIIVPLIAFDSQGYRLGYGKGYYDKYYEKNKNITYVGYAHAFQHINSLPSSSYDLKLNVIVTDKYVKNFI